jgi:hypothetical protein
LNTLSQRYGSQGLSVIGITHEGPRLTEPWVESKGAEYAYAYDRAGKLSASLGLTSLPSAVLIDAKGVIVWKGHPSSLPEKLIKESLEGAFATPVFEWGDSAKQVKKAFLKGNLAKAIASADQLSAKDELGTELGAMLRTMVEGQVKFLESALERGDVQKAYAGAKDMLNSVKGLPADGILTALITKVSGDKALKSVLRDQEKIVKVMSGEMSKRKQCAAIQKKLKKMLKEHSGTRTGELIEAAIESVQNKSDALRR